MRTNPERNRWSCSAGGLLRELDITGYYYHLPFRRPRIVQRPHKLNRGGGENSLQLLAHFAYRDILCKVVNLNLKRGRFRQYAGNHSEEYQSAPNRYSTESSHRSRNYGMAVYSESRLNN